ncbi:MAG TPA: 3-deoxy-D-manno-octulosonic acid transferase [Phycisphaerae bacterium]|nr:3-deoxy-D-manno-octulosonic acid transferase [Phycisphaerae bacterium]
MRWLVDIVYYVLAVILMPVILWRALTTGKYRRDWGQRTGRMPDLPPHPKRVWIHAVSLGEVNAVRGLISAWRTHNPEVEIVLSATTDTGIDRARELFPDLTIVRYPLDISRFVNRALDRIKPTMIVLVELEVWYQFVTLAAARSIPVAVVNGRFSKRSIQRFGWVRPIARRMFEPIAWVGAQDEAYAERFRQVGVPPDRVAVAGSMKWDTTDVVDELPGGEALAAAMGLDLARPIWVCGSTGPGEERIILNARSLLRADHPGLQVVIVPRKPERFTEVADLIRRSAMACIRRSESPDGTERTPTEGRIMLGDTMGELRRFYCLADVVFVGRSIAPMGGSDMMEVAALAKPIVVGPHTTNFADTVQQLQNGNAISIVQTQADAPDAPHKLAQAIDELLKSPERAKALAANARQVVQRNRGAVQRTLDSLVEILQRAQHSSA